MKYENSYLLSVAKTIKSQILAGIGTSAYYSWGVSKNSYGEYKNMPALFLRVHGFKHKGVVVIALNEGADLYEVYLLNRQNEVKRSFTDVYCDSLGSLLDREIETGNLSEDKYRKKVFNYYNKAV